ncbi:MAG: YigZ family protein [Bacteroidetes bacterium]|nr:YigZ family protein [Bacteroidota bacterium]
MDDQFKYRTVFKSATAEFKDRGSKFIAYAYQIATTQDAKEKLQELKKLHPKAAHHCYAYRLGTDGLQFRAVDDGEPSGSAGKPILGQIDSAGLTDTLVVVVRYFGGTLLGVPGLINAYKTATADALFEAKVTEKWIEDRYEVNFDYASMGEVSYLLKQAEATIYEQDMQLFCRMVAGIPRKHADSYVQRLSEIRGVKVEKTA